MYNCFDIAKKFIELSLSDGISMTPMKLLKLTYISHGYYLAFTNKPLFDNKIEAWQYGPVIPDLYHIIKRTNFQDKDYNILEMYSNKSLLKEDNKFISVIWNAYKKFDGGQLSSKTHESGTPWDKVYNGESFKVINNQIIKEYYKNKIDARKVQ